MQLGVQCMSQEFERCECLGCRYELCNEYGLYVIDEANVETHGFDPLQNNNEVRGKPKGASLSSHHRGAW